MKRPLKNMQFDKIRKKFIATLAVIFIAGSCFAAVKPTKDIKDLDAALKAGVPVIAKIGADWCFPCQKMNPILKELAVSQSGKAIFLDLDIYKNKKLAVQYKVTLIPAILFYDKHGKFKLKSEGFMSREDLLKKIEDLKLNK